MQNFVLFEDKDLNSDIEARDYVNCRFEEDRKAMTYYYRQWQINQAFYMGYQHISWNRERNVISVKPKPQNQVRLTAPLILPIINSLIGKHLRNRPATECTAESNDIEKKNKAKVSTQILRYFEQQLQEDLVAQDFVNWLKIVGNGWLHPSFDARAGIP